MPLFRPDEINVENINRITPLVDDYDIVFGSGDQYQAYLFAVLHRSIHISNLVGCGCSESEVEDLAKSCQRPCALLMTDCIAGALGDAGESLVERIKKWKPQTKALLIASDKGVTLLEEGRLDIYDAIISVNPINEGGVYRAVEDVLQKSKRHIDPSLRLRSSISNHGVRLSTREHQVLSLLAKGLTNREIASALFIAETTARDYVSAVYRKTESSNRAEAAAWAIRHGF